MGESLGKAIKSPWQERWHLGYMVNYANCVVDRVIPGIVASIWEGLSSALQDGQHSRICNGGI